MDPASKQTQHKAKYHRLTSPIWAFLVIVLLTLLIYLFPPDLQRIYSPYRLPPGSPTDASLLPNLLGPQAAQAQRLQRQCPARCQYWDGKRWHCACDGGGGDTPPLISATLLCDNWDSAEGWCRADEQLQLTASDAQGAVTISGNLNGTSFECGTTSSCTLALPIGVGTASYTVTDSSNTSVTGSTDWLYDPDPPVPDVSVSGTRGTGDWYISAVAISAAGSDSISGLAGASIFVDGGAEQSSETLSDGVHTVKATAIDNAGNQAWQTFTIRVDATAPQINSSVAGAPGSNGWYASDVQVSGNASDAMSGATSLEVSIEGAWQTYAAPITLTDGQHTVQFRATDQAGNVTTTSPQSISIDTIDPLITPTVIGMSENNSWYQSNAQVSATASDPSTGSGQIPGSGLATFEASMDGGAWTAYTAPFMLTDGVHIIQWRAKDKAGNIGQIIQSVSVDTAGPVIDLPAEWTLGKTVEYHATDGQSGLASVRVVIEDENERYPKVAWNEDASGASFDGEINWDGKFKDGTTAPAGTYLAWVKASDAAGNESVKLGKVSVPASIFSWFLPAVPTRTALPTAAPRPTATSQPALIVPVGESAVEAPAPQALVPVTSLTKPAIVVSSLSVGGVGNGLSVPNPVQSNLPLVSAAMAAMTAAAAYAAQKKKEEDPPIVATGDSGKKKNKKADTAPMSYRQIGKAYQASLNAFKERLQQNGLSAGEANAFKNQAIRSGSISSAAGLAQQAVNERQKERQVQRNQLLAKNIDPAPVDMNKVNQLATEMRAYDDIEDLRAQRTVEPLEVADKPWWQNALDTLTTSVPKAAGAVATSIQNATAGVPKMLGGPTSDRTSDGNPPPWQPIVDFVKWIGKTMGNLFGGGGQPKAKPTPNMDPIFTQIAPTISAQLTQAAQAKSTPTPTATPTPMPTRTLDDNPPKKPSNPIVDFFRWLFPHFPAWGSNAGSAPVSRMDQIYTQVAKLYTQTAQAMITPTATVTPASTATPTVTPTKLPGIPKIVLVTDGLNLRLEPSVYSDSVLPKRLPMPSGRIVYVDPNSPLTIADGFCWARVLYHDSDINARAILTSLQFADPLDDFVRWTSHGGPIDYFNAMPAPWAGTHVGEDYTPPVGGEKNPIVRASASGVVTNSGTQYKNGKLDGYGNYVIAEYPSGSLPIDISKIPGYEAGDSLYAMYAHLLSDVSGTIPRNSSVSLGMPIGTMGASGNTSGFIHLHFELRLGSPNQNLDPNGGSWYDPNSVLPIDPALIITPRDTFAGWAAQYMCTSDGLPIGDANLGPAP